MAKYLLLMGIGATLTILVCHSSHISNIHRGMRDSHNDTRNTRNENNSNNNTNTRKWYKVSIMLIAAMLTVRRITSKNTGTV